MDINVFFLLPLPLTIGSVSARDPGRVSIAWSILSCQ